MQAANTKGKRIVVWLTVDPQKEAEFNRWYQDDYMPRFAKKVPGIRSITRWRIPQTTTYLSVYDLDQDLSWDDFKAALKNPARDADRAEWHEWEVSALTEFHDGLFDQVFEYKP